jgi:hypothetical protein
MQRWPKQKILGSQTQKIFCQPRAGGARALNLTFSHYLFSQLHLYVKQVCHYKVKSHIPACAGMTKVFLQKLLFWFRLALHINPFF